MHHDHTRPTLTEIYQRITAEPDYRGLFVSWLREEGSTVPGLAEVNEALAQTEPLVAADAVQAVLAASSVSHETSMVEEATRLALAYLDDYSPEELIVSLKVVSRVPDQIDRVCAAARDLSHALHAGPASEPDDEGLGYLAATLNRPPNQVATAGDIILRVASLVLATPVAAVVAGIANELGGRADEPHPASGIAFLAFDARAAWELHNAALQASSA